MPFLAAVYSKEFFHDSVLVEASKKTDHSSDFRIARLLVTFLGSMHRTFVGGYFCNNRGDVDALRTKFIILKTLVI